MSFDRLYLVIPLIPFRLNPFRAGQCLSTNQIKRKELVLPKSQSLSSRAMSFDKEQKPSDFGLSSLNPFRAGQCLSTLFGDNFKSGKRSQSLSSRAMSFDE